MKEFVAALEKAKIVVRAFKPEKVRPIYVGGGSVSIEKFQSLLQKALGKEIKKFPDVIDLVNDEMMMRETLEQYAKEFIISEVEEAENKEFIVPENLKHLKLNIDTSVKKSNQERFFCTTTEEIVDPATSGNYFAERCGMSPLDAVHQARPVIPVYAPRSKRGITVRKDPETRSTNNYLNSYIPAAWELWKERNPKAWAALPSKPPKEILKLVQHFIPSKREREYLYAWIYSSLVTRSYVYLVLCGAPGVGKNRLKLVLSALHGAKNAVDGKKETLGSNGSRFNAQMSKATMIWFDELKYGPDMEPVMKEYQNSTISIERKGIDATDRSEIYSSMVISNNYPRDNYLLFNSRKFAPLVLGDKPLTVAMSTEEIGLLTDKCTNDGKHFDVKYVAQIAKWILKIGEKHTHKFPHLEYQGPKYWELAHTSMSRWQKIAILALTTENNRGPFPGWDEDKKAFLWSKVEEALRKKKEYDSKDYRDATTIKAFFETYRDLGGGKVFEVEVVSKAVVQDFWIKPIEGLKSGGKITLSADDALLLESLEKPEGPVRKKGMTDAQWQAEKKKFASTTKGKDNGKKAKRKLDL